QVKAIADAVCDGTDSLNVRLWHSEGFTALSWVLLDYVDVVVHIFKKDIRSFYNLERLWGDAKITALSDELADVKPAQQAKKTKPARKRSKKVSK
ncbi:MAG: ribosome silencing factor, partial [Ignavibacteriales bacterium]|nr:ribosome silencing factor [Ignavibacteriales bacterium]